MRNLSRNKGEGGRGSNRGLGGRRRGTLWGRGEGGRGEVLGGILEGLSNDL